MFQSVSQVIYCGGFSSVDPPLSIPNREVKRTYADGTDRPVGRVGSRRSSDPRTKQFARGSFFVPGLRPSYRPPPFALRRSLRSGWAKAAGEENLCRLFPAAGAAVAARPAIWRAALPTSRTPFSATTCSVFAVFCSRSPVKHHDLQRYWPIMLQVPGKIL